MSNFIQSNQKILSIIMVLLLLSSTFTPTVTGAEAGTDLDLNTVEEDLKLEKELEEQAEALKAGDEENDITFSAEGGLPRLTDGLDKEINIFNEAAEETHMQQDQMDGNIEQGLFDAFAEEKEVDVIIYLKDDTDHVSLLEFTDESAERSERIANVQGHLQEVAAKTQEKLLVDLEDMEQKQQVSNIEPLWIINGIAASVTEDALKALAERNDIEKVLKEEIIEIPEVTGQSEPRLPEWGLEKVHAPDVWGQYGLDGEGIIVGIMDTGVEETHEALKHNYLGRDGDHDIAWADFSGHDYETPQDGNGHGTHVAGTAVGGGEGEPIGVAPGAEWIAAKIFNDGGAATESGILQAFEWFMAPGGDPENAPHVVNNSWGNSNTYNTSFHEAVLAWRAAGIIPLFAAGNDGPGSESIGSPASFPESIAVGATDVNDHIASFSSRGPVYWEGERYLKPEISAPGHEIYSAWPGNGYNTISGTSMAAPHAAGVIALILQANPDADMEEMETLLTETARTEMHMGEVPNDLYGYGIINAYQAVTEAAFAGEFRGIVTDDEGKAISAQIIIEEENIYQQTGEDGTFELKLREGTHEVAVEAFGYITEKQAITIVKDEVAEVTWELEAADQYNITGTVTDADQSPVAHAYVQVLDTPLDTVRTDENGQFVFSAVPEGEYHIVVSGKGISSSGNFVQVSEDKIIDFQVEAGQLHSGEHWLTNNNNNARNAVSEEDISLHLMEEDWSTGVSGNIIFSSPAVNEDTIVTATDSGSIQAFDLENGEEKWTFRTGMANRGTPTIHEDTVYVAGGQDNKIYALNINSGVVKWEAAPGNEAIYETPMYDDGVLYLTSSTSNETVVTALHADDGERLWDTVIESDTYFGAAATDEYLIIGSMSAGSLYALSKEDGSEVWTFDISGEGFASQPVVIDGIIYAFSTDFSSNGTLWAINAESGEEIWNYGHMGDTQAASPVVYEDIIVASSASNASSKGFDRHTGELIWENENVSTAVNNGSAAGNGLFFLVDNTGALKAVDVFSGRILEQRSLEASSSSTPAIISGRVVITTQTGIQVFSSPGVLSGVIQDTDGNPVSGFARVIGTDKKAEADTDGKFELTVLPGEFDVIVGHYGMEQVHENISFHSGTMIEKTYMLDAVAEGELSGQILDSRSEEPITDAAITVQDTELETRTDENGNFSFDSIYEGSYQLELEASGFLHKQAGVEVNAGETTTVTLNMDPIDVAVLNDYESSISNLLNQQEIPAEKVEWDTIIEELANYQVVYLNGAYESGGWSPEKELMDELLAEASDQGVSIVFANTWGLNYGSIPHLSEFYHDPETVQHDYGRTGISLVIEQEHPILGDTAAGDRITVMNSGMASWFNGYSGRNLATLGSRQIGDVGTGVAYKPVTQDSAHLLLSTHAAASWNSPVQNWLPVQHDILTNGVSYLLDDTSYGQVDGNVVNQQGEPLEVKVEITETGVYESTDENGEFSLFHDEGTYEIEVRATGYERAVVEVDFVNGEVKTETIELVSANEGQLTGSVTDAHTANPLGEATVILSSTDGDIVTETVTSDNGYYEFTDLDADTYYMEFQHENYVTAGQEIEVTGSPLEVNQNMTPSPYVGIIGDRSGDDNLASILEDVNISSENHSTIENITEEMENYDVIYFNSATGVNENDLDRFEEAADELGVSIIYGDTYFGSGGIRNLHDLRDDPAQRETINIRSSPAQYIPYESHPIFSDYEEGEPINILQPDGSRVGTFDDYSGFALAGITHEEMEEEHGLGVAYKPRSANNLELLMSGHSMGIAHTGEDYTEEGIQMFANAVIWAAYEDFNVISGSVTDENGDPLKTEIKLEINGNVLNDATTYDDENFSIASIDGEAVVTFTSFGYETKTIPVEINENLEPLQVEMKPKEEVGALEGYVSHQSLMDSLKDVHIDIAGYPREAYTDSQGYYHIGNLEPGSYEVIITKEDFLQERITVEISEGETKSRDIDLRSSPTIGIIVDATSSSAVSLAEYLENKGFHTTSMFYDDLEMLEDVDLVYANSDYNNSLIPEEDTFIRFTEKLDETETPVIWAGDHGGRGSIRYLIDYFGDPGVEYRGSGADTSTAYILEDHPIFDGVEESFEFTTNSGYYYGFDDYSGSVLADYENDGAEEEGYLIGFNGRTVNSVEILLGGMTFSHGFHPGIEHFDENRERIINNAIMWAIDNEESFSGEIRGQIENDLGHPVQADVTVEETGQRVKSDQDGNFFLGLPEGSYTLIVEAFGHVTGNYEVSVVNGEILEETFLLESENIGELTGEVRGGSTGDLIEGAVIDVIGTPLEGQTDEDGTFALGIPEGEYDVRVTADGYQPQTMQISIISGETETLEVTLADSEMIAFVGSAVNQNRVIPFLEDHGYEVTGFTVSDHEELKENMGEYALVIFNDSLASISEEAFTELIDTGDELQVSMIFASQFGTTPIHQLRDYYNNPESISHSFEADVIEYEVLEEHPIFRGFETGETISILENPQSNQQYSVFEGYSGTMVADITHPEEGRLGSGLAYDYRSSSHAHILLGSLASSGYGNPDDRWTEEAKTIYINAIDWALNTSLGEINGVVKNSDGEPIENASVTIEEENISVQTNDQGRYTIGVGTGEHTVTVSAIGYEPEETTVVIENVGDAVEQDFTLEASEQMTLYGTVTEAGSGEGLENVQVTVSDLNNELEYETVTDEDGNYQIGGLLESDYEATFDKDGYHPVTEGVAIESGENVELNVTISSYNIAVIGDFRGEISALLQENELAAEPADWNISNHIGLYDLVIVNSAGTEEEMETLIDASDAENTSLVFLDTWGSDGAIRTLGEVEGSPELDSQGYNEGEIILHADDLDHPIFAGMDEGISILTESSPYATFKSYEGELLANIELDEEDKGTAIGYEFKSDSHLHLLLSVFETNNMTGPDRGWTENGRQLFVQAIEWARDAEQEDVELPSPPVWKKSEDEFRGNGRIVVGGRADPNTVIQIVTDDEVIKEVRTNPGGIFNAHLELDEGTYELHADAVAETGTVRSEEPMIAIVKTKIGRE
ncbi:carboxypeptidase regulatory-like domain-containing protein [Virgibacillus kimchii]